MGNEFSNSFSALGVCIHLEKFAFGQLEFSNTEKRAKELSTTITEILERGTLTVLQSQKLRGRMEFADGQLFGRMGRLCMRAVMQHAFPFKGKAMDDHTKDAMQRFVIFLNIANPECCN